MNIAQIRKYDIANGTGIRVSIFVSGCRHACKGCFNQDYWSFSYGEKLDKDKIEYIKELSKSEFVSGITILGGEPFQQDLDELYFLISEVKSILRPEQDIWIYSGYTYEELIPNHKAKNILDICDVLVDGKFDEGLKNLRLKFKGSSNQRVINLHNSTANKIEILNGC